MREFKIRFVVYHDYVPLEYLDRARLVAALARQGHQFEDWQMHEFAEDWQEETALSVLVLVARGDDGESAAKSAALAFLDDASPIEVQDVDQDLVTMDTIADRLGASPQRVKQLVGVSRVPGGFPHPLAIVGEDRLWDWESVRRWSMESRSREYCGSKLPEESNVAGLTRGEVVRVRAWLLETRLILQAAWSSSTRKTDGEMWA